MPKLLLYITLFFNLVYSLEAQQISLKGQVSIHNSKYATGRIEYVQNAYASAPFAGSDDTDSQGVFELPFVGIDAGTVVKVKVVKSGLEVVNEYDLQRVIIGRKPLLRVYLIEAGKLALAQTELYNISREALYARKDAIINELTGKATENKTALKDLENFLGQEIADVATAINLLESKIENLEKRLPVFAQELATVNLDFASDLYIEAYEYFRKGEIEKAITILDDAKLETAYENAMATREEGERLEYIGQDLQEQSLLQIEQLVDNYKLKAESCILLFQNKKAITALNKIVDILEKTKIGVKDELNLASIYDLLGLCHMLEIDQEQAAVFFSKSLKIKEKLLPKDALELADSYGNLAIVFQQINNLKEAISLQKKSISIKEESLVPSDPSLLDSYNTLASLYRDSNKGEEALTIQLKTISRMEENEVDPVLSASVYNNLGLTYKKFDKNKKAFDAFKKGILFLEQNSLTDRLLAATIYNNLGNSHRAIGEYEEALKMHYEALTIQEKILPQKHPRFYDSYDGIAFTLIYMGEYNKALEFAKKAHAINSSSLKANHAQIGYSHYCLASIYHHIGDTDLTLKHITKALEIFEQQSNIDFSKIVNSYEILSFVYSRQGREKESLVTMEKSLSLAQELNLSNYSGLARSWSNLAINYGKLGMYDKALNVQLKAIKIQKKILGEDHINFGKSNNSLALIYDHLGESDKALSIILSTIETQEKVLDENHPLLATFYNTLSNVLFSLEKYEEAAQAQIKDIAIQKSKTSTHPNLGISIVNLGQTYQKMKKYEKAIECYQESLAILKFNYPDNHPQFGMIYHLLGTSYYAVNQIEKAIEYTERAVNILSANNSPGVKEVKKQLYDYKKKMNSENGVLNGRNLIAEEKYEAAIIQLQEDIKNNPDDPLPYYGIGISFYYLNSWEIADIYLERGFAKDSILRKEYLEYSSLANARLRKFQKTKKQLDQLQKNTSDNKQLYRVWAIFYALQNDQEKTLSNLEKAVELGYDDLAEITKEEAFKILHQEPRYQAIIQKLQNKE